METELLTPDIEQNDIKQDKEQEINAAHPYNIYSDPLLTAYLRDISNDELLTREEEVELFKSLAKAKQKKQNITTGVSVANLLFTDRNVENFDSNFKLLPPLRDEKTRKSLIKAVISGDIDVVISDHWPQNVESKECEFQIAEFVYSCMGQKMDVRVKVGLCLTIFIVLLVPVKGVQSDNHTVSILEERQLSCGSGLYGVWNAYMPDY